MEQQRRVWKSKFRSRQLAEVLSGRMGYQNKERSTG
jgi:hypothetical protein